MSFDSCICCKSVLQTPGASLRGKVLDDQRKARSFGILMGINAETDASRLYNLQKVRLWAPAFCRVLEMPSNMRSEDVCVFLTFFRLPSCLETCLFSLSLLESHDFPQVSRGWTKENHSFQIDDPPPFAFWKLKKLKKLKRLKKT